MKQRTVSMIDYIKEVAVENFKRNQTSKINSFTWKTTKPHLKHSCSGLFLISLRIIFFITLC